MKVFLGFRKNQNTWVENQKTHTENPKAKLVLKYGLKWSSIWVLSLGDHISNTDADAESIIDS